MKTINEVISAYEICYESDYCSHPKKCDCPYLQNDYSCGKTEMYKDTLFYLTEYQYIVDKCTSVLASKYPDQNDFIPWGELKTMIGKPVWLEGDNIKPHWDIIARIEYDYYHNSTECEFYVLGGTFTHSEECYGKTWRAYRAERYEKP